MLQFLSALRGPPSSKEMLSMIRNGVFAKLKNHVEQYGINSSCNSYQLLCEALKSRQKEISLYLLTQGADVNGKSERFGVVEPTAVHLAVHLNDKEIMELLLQKGALIDVVAGGRKCTPLCDAVRYNKVEMIEILLKHGADINIPNRAGQTPVMVAAEKRGLVVMRLLLNHHADPNSALHTAAESGKIEIVKLLMKKGASINNKAGDFTPLHVAIENRHGQLVDFLLKEGADINGVEGLKQSALQTAVKTGCPIIVNIVLSHRPDKKLKENQDAMHVALRLQNDSLMPHDRFVFGEIIQSMLSYGFTIDDTDAGDPHHLFVAIRNGYIETVRELIKRGSNLKVLRNSILTEIIPLYPNTLSNQNKLAQILVHYGADENSLYYMEKRPFRRTLFRTVDFDMFKLLLTDKSTVKNNPDLLKFAVWHGSLDIAKCLLRHGADVNAQDTSGRAALHFCVLRPNNMLCPISQRNRTSGNAEKNIVKLLVSYGADINSSTGMGESALLIGAQNWLTEIVEMLVEMKADVNAVDGHGTSALHHCVRNGDLRMSEYLLIKGAKVNARGKDDMTPLHVASERGHLDVVQSLLEFGADVNLNSKKGTPLHIACIEGRVDVAKFLVEYGADVNVTFGDETPVSHLAGRPPMIEECSNFLISYLVQHLSKMKAANMYLNEKNSFYVGPMLPEDLYKLGIDPFRAPGSCMTSLVFPMECEEEIAKMKREKIEDSNFTFYDVLVGSDARLAKLSANRYLKQSINSEDFESNFPNYAGLISRRIQKGKWMRELNEKCRGIFLSIGPHLPDLCVERILAFMPVADLRMLVNAWHCSDLTDSKTR